MAVKGVITFIRSEGRQGWGWEAVAPCDSMESGFVARFSLLSSSSEIGPILC